MKHHHYPGAQRREGGEGFLDWNTPPWNDAHSSLSSPTHFHHHHHHHHTRPPHPPIILIILDISFAAVPLASPSRRGFLSAIDSAASAHFSWAFPIPQIHIAKIPSILHSIVKLALLSCWYRVKKPSYIMLRHAIYYATFCLAPTIRAKSQLRLSITSSSYWLMVVPLSILLGRIAPIHTPRWLEMSWARWNIDTLHYFRNRRYIS